jgi:hypothetical protein
MNLPQVDFKMITIFWPKLPPLERGIEGDFIKRGFNSMALSYMAMNKLQVEVNELVKWK